MYWPDGADLHLKKPDSADLQPDSTACAVREAKVLRNGKFPSVISSVNDISPEGRRLQSA